jgi:hypothetical protein
MEEQALTRLHKAQTKRTNINIAKILNKLRFQNIAILLITLLISGLYFNNQHNDRLEYSKNREAYWKLFWRATAMAQMNDVDQMNECLNKLVLSPLFGDENRMKRTFLKSAQYGNQLLYAGLVAREILHDTPNGIEDLTRMVKAQKKYPKEWQAFTKATKEKENAQISDQKFFN